MNYAFLHGIILAFGLIMPLGVQNIFIFNQGGSQRHFLHAMPTVITATVCDAILITCAVMGVSVVILNLAWLKSALYAVGFCFLIYMGFVVWFRRPNHSVYAGQKPLSAKRQIMFSLSVSLLNPHALLDTIAIIGTNSLQFVGMAKFIFTFACIIVSGLWFFSLSVAGHFLQKLDKSGRWQHRMNRFSAIILWGMGLYLAQQLFYQ